jgi:hypothetical protein
MELKDLIKAGLLGYQPIFFPNGVISGAGFQFFGNLRNMRASDPLAQTAPPEDAEPPAFKANDSDTFNRGRLGNLYVPPGYGQRSEFDSEFYYCVDEGDVRHLAKYNLLLLEMYKYFVSQSMKLAAEHNCKIGSMIEVGSNTCLFPLAFTEEGVAECHGADIVDYSSVVDLLSEIKNQKVSFHHMPDDSEATWRSLPKADLVWSYAVVLHQSNPLAHLTRLASLARKAIFVMTVCEPQGWKSEKDMGIRYLSANSYYNADFPNCFDVTIVSPELINYSLKRLGFSEILQIPHPRFDSLDETIQGDLDYWMGKHCFLLAFRAESKDADSLNDYSVSSERSPYKGENVLVHSGSHHNVVLSNSRYFIVAHGKRHDPTQNSERSFSTLGNALKHLNSLPDEQAPYPVRAKSLQSSDVIRFKKRFYLCPHGMKVDFGDSASLTALPSLDRLEKWERLLSVLGEAGVAALDDLVVDVIGDVLIVKSKEGTFRARKIGTSERAVSRKAWDRFRALRRLFRGNPGQMGGGAISRPDQATLSVEVDEIPSGSLRDVVKEVSVRMLLASMTSPSMREAILYRHVDGRILKRLESGEIQVEDGKTGSVLSVHDELEKAWSSILKPWYPGGREA